MEKLFFKIRTGRGVARGRYVLFFGALLALALYCGPALAGTPVTSNTDTSWRFQGNNTYDFAPGLNFHFTDDKQGAVVVSPYEPGVTTASPDITLNSLGMLNIVHLNGTGWNSVGAYVEQRAEGNPPQKLFATGSDVTLAGVYNTAPSPTSVTTRPTVAGLYADGTSTYNPANPIGAYAEFNNKEAHITALVNPSTPTSGHFGAAIFDHNGGASFNGDLHSLNLQMNANASSDAAVLSESASHVEFHGRITEIVGNSATSTPGTTLYGVYGHGNYSGGLLYEPQVGLLFDSARTGIGVATTGAQSAYGMYLQGGRTTVTNNVKEFAVGATLRGTATENRDVLGIQAWHHEIVDIQAENTFIDTYSEAAVSNFANRALLAWANGNINIGGKQATITSSGVSNGGVALYSFGDASNIDLAPGVTGNPGSDITINADKITITSKTTGTGEAIAAYAYAWDTPATIHVNSDATGTDQGKTVNVTGTIYASGNEDSANPFGGKAFFNFGNANSQFTGRAKYWPGDGDGSEINIGLTNGARWNMTGNSWVTNFTAGGGHAYLGTDASHFTTLARDESDFTPTQLWIDNLKGTNGNFYLRADIDGDKADTVFIRNGAGSHSLFVRSHGAEPSSEAMNQYLVHEEAGDAAFALGNPQKLVDTGLYVYELAQRKANNADGENVADEWYLKRATRPDQPVTPDQPAQPSKPILSPSGEAEAALSGIAGNYALWYGQQTDLRKRLGEIRYGAQTGLWARGFADKARLDGFGGTSFTQNTYGGSIGYDKMVAVDETYMWMLGMQLRGARADQHVNGSWGGHGDLSSLGVGLYSTWAHADGWYVDAVSTIDWYNHKIRTTMLDGTPVNDDRSSYGLGASLEAGRKFDFGYSNENRNYWFVEPQLQLSYFWVKGGDFTASNGMKIDQDNMDSLTGRAGVVLGKKFALGSDLNDPRYVQPYIKAGVNHEFLGEQVVHINNTRMDSDLAGTRVYYGAGIDWQATDSLRVYAQVEREHGAHFTREVNVSAGLKWEF